MRRLFVPLRRFRVYLCSSHNMMGLWIHYLIHPLTICLASHSDTLMKHIKQSGVVTEYLPHSPTIEVTSLHCAAVCLLSTTWCHGYSFDSTSGCELYSKICPVKNGDREVFIRNLHNMTRTDVALGKPASMSSERNGIWVASLGNDGIYYRDAETQDYGGDLALFFHTNNDQDPWWRVDLEGDYCVSAVYFLNRGWGGWIRTKDVVITVAEALAGIEDNGDNVCGRIVGLAERWDNLVTCTNYLIGRFVQLKCMALTYFHLYEVEVHGY